MSCLSMVTLVHRVKCEIELSTKNINVAGIMKKLTAMLGKQLYVIVISFECSTDATDYTSAFFAFDFFCMKNQLIQIEFFDQMVAYPAVKQHPDELFGRLRGLRCEYRIRVDGIKPAVKPFEEVLLPMAIAVWQIPQYASQNPQVKKGWRRVVDVDSRIYRRSGKCRLVTACRLGVKLRIVRNGERFLYNFIQQSSEIAFDLIFDVFLKIIRYGAVFRCGAFFVFIDTITNTLVYFK